MVFTYETTVVPDWIDYNGHMRDAYYGLIFSLAVDALQDEIGFDEDYRARTGCTIYLVEDHKYYLQEVKVGERVRVDTVILDSDEKRFHLHMQMMNSSRTVAVGEFMELHVCQRPTPHAVPMPERIAALLSSARLSPAERNALARQSRSIKLKSARQQ